MTTVVTFKYAATTLKNRVLKNFARILSALVLFSGSVSVALASEEAPQARRFNDVLFDLLNEFSYELKTNKLSGVKNVSVRKIAVSEAIPKSYESYLESLVLERFRKFSKIRVIQCTTCRMKKTVVENGRLVITMPINNPAELDMLSNQFSIDTWLDVALLYQETGMILAFNAFDAKTKELIWSRSYNSETIYQKNTIPDAAEAAKEAEQNKPEPSSYIFAFTMGWHMVANVKTSANMVGLNIRMAEQFNEKRSEIGAMVAPIVDPGLIVSDYSVTGDPKATGEVQTGTTTETIKPFTIGAALFATYHHNFSPPDNIDKVRYGAHTGIGGVYAPGYITFAGRGGGFMKFGRRWILEGGMNYSMPTTLTIKDQFTYKTKGGLGADVTFGVVF